MGEFFNVDNKFFRWLNKIIDCLMLSVLWMLCFIPLGLNLYLATGVKAIILFVPCILTAVPAGAATTALYYAMNKVIRHERGYASSEFWHSFRSNFKQAACATMLLTTLILVLSLDTYFLYEFSKAGKGGGAFIGVFLILLALAVMWMLYIFPYIARFENTTKQMLKNTALIALGNFPKTLLMFVLLVGMLVLVYALPVVGIVIPAVYTFSINLVMENIFRKYMTEEDLAAEDERNRDDFN